jgi:hypothetical protein
MEFQNNYYMKLKRFKLVARIILNKNEEALEKISDAS